MPLLMHKPLWLHPHTLVYHRQSDTVFVVHRLQQQRGTQNLVLLTSPHDGDAVKRYMLSQCDRAWWHHFKQPRFVMDGAQSILIDQPQQQLTTVGSEAAQRLELNLVHDAALKLAEMFDGEIVQLSSATLLHWELQP